MAKKKSKRSDKMAKYMEKREKEQTGGSNYLQLSDVEFFSVKQKDIEIDIVPYIVTVDNHPFADPDETWYEKTFEVHKNIGPEESSYVCPRSVGAGKCPICEEGRRLSRDPDATKEEIQALRPSKRQLFNVLVDGKVALWDVSVHLFGKMLDETVRIQANHPKRPRPEVLSFFELEEGQVLECNFEKKSWNGHDFYDVKRIDFYDRDDIEEDILDKTHNLDEALRVLSYEQLLEIFIGVPSDDNEEEEETPRSRRKAKKEEPEEEEETPRSRRSSRRKVEEEEVEEEEEDNAEEEGEEEPEEEKPRRSRRTRKQAEPAEEEAEEEEEEQEQEEEQETRRSSRRSGRTDRSSRSRRGRSKEAEPEEEEAEEPKRGRRSSRKSSKKECPNGYEFGTDCEEYDECEDCPLWEACLDAKEAME